MAAGEPGRARYLHGDRPHLPSARPCRSPAGTSAGGDGGVEMRRRRTRGWRKATPRAAALGAGGLLLALLAPATTAAAAPGGSGCEYRDNDTYDELLECVTVDGVLEHLEELQKIADNSTDPDYPGTRAAGTDGYA